MRNQDRRNNSYDNMDNIRKVSQNEECRQSTTLGLDQTKIGIPAQLYHYQENETIGAPFFVPQSLSVSSDSQSLPPVPPIMYTNANIGYNSQSYMEDQISGGKQDQRVVFVAPQSVPVINGANMNYQTAPLGSPSFTIPMYTKNMNGRR